MPAADRGRYVSVRAEDKPHRADVSCGRERANTQRFRAESGSFRYAQLAQLETDYVDQ